MAVDSPATQAARGGDPTDAPLFSADSHVYEDVSLWEGLLPPEHFGTMDFSELHKRPGRVDPVARLDEMALDGVCGEVLYTSLGLHMFGFEDVGLQEQCFRRYNDWLATFCAVAPEQLLGIGMLSAYEIDHAVAELRRCHAQGLSGCQVWQSAHPDLPFSGRHYDPLFAVAEELAMPVSMHILTGYKAGLAGQGLSTGGTDSVEAALKQYRVSVNLKLLGCMDSLLELIFSGTLDRFPGLRIVLVENEVGWIPFVLDQFDYYAERFGASRPTANERPPSDYFGSQVFATFFRDPVGMRLFDWWGVGGCMWSSDYPHGNSTWPHSQEVVAENLGYLDEAARREVVRGTARRLYGLEGS